MKEDVIIRPYRTLDKDYVIKLYQEIFAEPPWNECWSYEDVLEDINFCLRQKDPIILVAERKRKIVGFNWGYRLPLKKFPFLGKKLDKKCFYVDELGVKKEFRRRKIGTRLMQELIKKAKRLFYSSMLLRTDVKGVAYLFYLSLGFKDIEVRDPKYPERTYMKKEIS